MKLHYDEIVACPRPIAQLWEKLLSPNNAIPDYAALALTIEKGVTKQRRGEAWRLLVRARNSMDIQQQQTSMKLTSQQLVYVERLGCLSLLAISQYTFGSVL